MNGRMEGKGEEREMQEERMEEVGTEGREGRREKYGRGNKEKAEVLKEDGWSANRRKVNKLKNRREGQELREEGRRVEVGKEEEREKGIRVKESKQNNK